MITLTAAEVVHIVGGRLVCVSSDATVTQPVEFDSRKVREDSLFLALPGARVGGHDFIGQVVAAGATTALAARDVGQPVVVVKPLGKQDSNAGTFTHSPDGSGTAMLGALGKLACYVVDELKRDQPHIVGVMGSVGKTSTKDMMATLLRIDGPTVAPEGSFNNEIGHPYTMLQCIPETKYLAAEMSTHGIEHVTHLARIAPPTIGTVLNVGTAHLGEFGSREVIAQAKGELVEALPAAEQGDVAVFNADDDYVTGMTPRTQAKVIFFSADKSSERHATADYRTTNVQLDDFARASFDLHVPDGCIFPIQLQVYGAHRVASTLAAIVVAVEPGIDAEQAVGAVAARVAASERRMDVQQSTGNIVVINDSYNANPDSICAGIDALARTAAGPTHQDASSWAVLGQTGELGGSAEDEHSSLGGYLVGRGIDRLVAVGESSNVHALVDKAEELGLNTSRVPDTSTATDLVAAEVRPDDVVLVKTFYADGIWRVAGSLATKVRATPEGESREEEQVIQLILSGTITFLVGIFLTPVLIRKFSAEGLGQKIREEEPKSHLRKWGTLAMGGITIIAAIVAGYFLSHLVTYIQTGVGPSASGLLVMFLVLAMGALDFADDFIKLYKERNLGLNKTAKLVGQLAAALIFGVLLLRFPGASDLTPGSTSLSLIQDIPFLNPTPGPVWFDMTVFLVSVLIVIAAWSDAVNFTNGLDGLTTGTTVLLLVAYTLISFWQFRNSCEASLGNDCYGVRDLLDIAIISVAGLGAYLGFLWQDVAPAKAFMGDIGSLALGGLVASLSFVTKTELLMVIIGFISVMGVISVAIQIVVFQTTGKRVFRMASLHHHFESGGWAETTVVVRFQLLASIFNMIDAAIFYND